jgi:spermidine/putrescine-binding protein
MKKNKRREKMAKQRWISMLFIITALVLTACAGGQAETTTAPAAPTTEQEEPVAAPPTSTTLNLYAWSEYVPQQLLDDFSAKYGITVNYDTFSSNEEMLAKLQAGATEYDVIQPSDYTVVIMIKDGMLETIDVSQLSNFGNLDPRFINRDYDPGNQYSIPYQWGTTALAYDKTLVPTEPTSWSDLWDPAYEGRLVFLDDEREVMAMALKVLGYDGNSTNEAELTAAGEKLVELKPNILLFDSDAPETVLITGEAWAGLVYNGNASLGYQENPNIEFICPTEGCTIWFDNLAIPKGAPHKDAAMLFLDWVLDAQQSALITTEFSYLSPNKAALDWLKENDPEYYDGYMSYSATNPSDEFLAKAGAIIDVGEATLLYDNIWTDFKSR